MAHKHTDTEGGPGTMDTLDHDELRSLTPGGEPGGLVTVKLDSCNSTWFFQPGRMRYRRELKGIGIPGVRTGWRPYYGLRFDDELDSFTVYLSPDGTRLLSSWCHPPGSEACTNCAGHAADGQLADDVCQLAP